MALTKEDKELVDKVKVMRLAFEVALIAFIISEIQRRYEHGSKRQN